MAELQAAALLVPVPLVQVRLHERARLGSACSVSALLPIARTAAASRSDGLAASWACCSAVSHLVHVSRLTRPPPPHNNHCTSISITDHSYPTEVTTKFSRSVFAEKARCSMASSGKCWKNYWKNDFSATIGKTIGIVFPIVFQ